MKEKVVIDANNLYVQGLMKAFNEFMLEETQKGSMFAELRLKEKIETLKNIFSSERRRMVVNGGYFQDNIFQRMDPDTHELVFKIQ